MATTNDYCTRDDLESRLSQQGVVNVADDDQDDVASESELVASLDDAIRSANAEINWALEPWITTPLTQNSANPNEYLRQLAIDLAAAHVASRRGGVVPESLAAAAERARANLDEIFQGRRVPGLTYPIDSYEQDKRTFGVPRAANPIVHRGSGRCGASGCGGRQSGGCR